VIHVIHHQRSPAQGGHSLERVFSTVRGHLGANFDVRVDTLPRPSTGLLPRALNSAHASRYTADVHHVTGDVHYLTLTLPRDRTVLTVHDCIGVHTLAGYRRRLFRIFWLYLPVRASRIVTAVSDATRRELAALSGQNSDQIRVIGNPVPDGIEQAARASWPARPTLLQVGTGPNKNLSRLAQALSGLPCRLVVVGRCGGGNEEALRASGIQWVSLQDITDAEMPALYRQADVVVFASTYEGFGLPIVEAQATGRPLVTSRLAPMSDVAGEGACLVDPYDIESIRSGIVRVLGDSNYRDFLVQRGFENVRRFEPGRIASQYARLYEELSPHTESDGHSK
jgi:glycosyltransferase involved in cell wall biosynthesis